MALNSFIQVTQAPEKVALKYLKSAGWNVQSAVNSFFASGGSSSGGSPASSKAVTDNLNKLFDQYRQPGDPQDTISVNGTMSYIEALGLDLEEPAVLALCQMLNAPTMGEFARAGFVDGWKALQLDTLEKQRAHIPTLRTTFSTSESLQKKVYMFTYAFARQSNQKSLPLDTAIEYWKLLLGERWKGHIGLWIEFLETEWKKSVAKDTWNMLWDFTGLCKEDPSLTGYDDEGAWPSILDSFVDFVRRKNAMDVSS